MCAKIQNWLSNVTSSNTRLIFNPLCRSNPETWAH